jgi:alkylation response protein AidB-like acyl-CoA dehydrogenase
MTARLAALPELRKPWNPIALRSHPALREWSGLDLPTRVGGAAWPARDMALLFRFCGRRDAELRDLIGAGHARLLSLVPTRRFDAELKAVAGGSGYCAIAITEPDVGSDIRALGTTATPSDDGYVLDGTKQYISRIDECTHFLVFTSVKRAASDPLITAFLVPRATSGLVTAPMAPAGLASVTWGRVALERVRVPRANRIGGEGQGLSLFVRHFSYWRTLMAALAIGSAEAAVDQAAAWMRSRHAFGGPIGRFSHLQQALAQWVARLKMAWLLVDDVALRLDSNRVSVADGAMAKAEAVEVAIAAIEWSMGVLGGAGYVVDNGLEKRYRDMRGLRIADGTTDVLRGQVARALLGERLYELSLNRNIDVARSSDTPSQAFW